MKEITISPELAFAPIELTLEEIGAIFVLVAAVGSPVNDREKWSKNPEFQTVVERLKLRGVVKQDDNNNVVINIQKPFWGINYIDDDGNVSYYSQTPLGLSDETPSFWEIKPILRNNKVRWEFSWTHHELLEYIREDETKEFNSMEEAESYLRIINENILEDIEDYE